MRQPWRGCIEMCRRVYERVWTENMCWGDQTPSNAVELVYAANEMIVAKADELGVLEIECNYQVYDEFALYCERLWDEFCDTGRVGHVVAVY